MTMNAADLHRTAKATVVQRVRRRTDPGPASFQAYVGRFNTDGEIREADTFIHWIQGFMGNLSSDDEK